MPTPETMTLTPRGCKEESIWKNAQKWMDAPKKPETPEQWKIMLDELCAYFGGMLRAYDSTIRSWEERFPEPDCYGRWDCGGDINEDEEREIHQYQGSQEALEYVKDRHSEVSDAFMRLVSGN